MFKNVNGSRVALSAEEVLSRAIEEDAWAAKEDERAAAKAADEFYNDADLPTLAEKVDALYESDAKVAEIKARIDAVKIKHGRV